MALTIAELLVAGTPARAAGPALRLEWPGAPTGLAALAAVAAALAAAYLIVRLYRRETGAGRRLRWLSCALRLLALAAVGAILLQPSLVRDVERVLPSRVVVLADRSASMSARDVELPGRPGVPATRHDLVRHVLTHDGMDLVGRMRRSNDVKLATFAGDVAVVADLSRRDAGGEDAPAFELAWSATGPATDLSRALDVALDSASAPGQLAAVVVLTDGRDTTGGDVDAAVRRAVRLSVPLHLVAVGSTARPRNVEIVELVSDTHALADLPLRMQAVVQSDGYEGAAVELVLTATPSGADQPQDVLRRPVSLAGRGRRQVVDLTHVPPAVGPIRYVAAIAPLDGEFRTEDNAAAREVLVAADRIEVLLVSGGPSREHRFLKSLLARSPAFAVTEWLPGTGGSPLSGELDRFGLVVLCDPPPDALSEEQQAALAAAVEEGTGLAFIAGPLNTPEFSGGAGLGRLADLLPIVPDAERTAAMVGAPDYHTGPRAVSLGEAVHSITEAGPGVDARAFWRDMPPVYWVLPVARAKRGAAVLLRCADPAAPEGAPLACVQPYGAGRVFYCGSPETWRWRRAGIERYDRFWLQALRYCAAGRLRGGDRRVRLSLDRYAYDQGEAVTVRVATTDPDALRPDGDGAHLHVEQNGRAVATVRLAPAAPAAAAAAGADQFEGVFYPEAFGRFDAVLTTADGARVVEPFQVRWPAAELRDVTLAERALRRLADATGGRCLTPAEAGLLPDLIPDLSATIIEPGPLRPAWDSAYVLAALIVALAAEWLARKLMGMQ